MKYIISKTDTDNITLYLKRLTLDFIPKWINNIEDATFYDAKEFAQIMLGELINYNRRKKITMYNTKISISEIKISIEIMHSDSWDAVKPIQYNRKPGEY